jgi:hypothetical protein
VNAKRGKLEYSACFAFSRYAVSSDCDGIRADWRCGESALPYIDDLIDIAAARCSNLDQRS